MPILQTAHRDFTTSKLFDSSAKAARASVALDDMLRFQTEICLPYSEHAVFDCLRDMGCLLHWWPKARSLCPIPPGLCNVGDMAVLDVRSESVLLRVLAFKPGKRILLAIGLSHAPVLLDLSVSTSLEHTCCVRLMLETPQGHGHLASARQWIWLRLLGASAAAALDRHLRVSPRLEGGLLIPFLNQDDNKAAM